MILKNNFDKKMELIRKIFVQSFLTTFDVDYEDKIWIEKLKFLYGDEVPS